MPPITPMHTANMRSGRMGYKPEAFVIHVTEGSGKGAISWCMNPKSQVSYHYIVDENARVIELVRPENTAWHAGLAVNASWKHIRPGINANLYTIGIAYAGHASEGPTLQQVVAISKLVKALSTQYAITLDDNHVIPHNAIRADKQCPGPKLNTACIVSLAMLRETA